MLCSASLVQCAHSLASLLQISLINFKGEITAFFHISRLLLITLKSHWRNKVIENLLLLSWQHIDEINRQTEFRAPQQEGEMKSKRRYVMDNCCKETVLNKNYLKASPVLLFRATMVRQCERDRSFEKVQLNSLFASLLIEHSAIAVFTQWICCCVLFSLPLRKSQRERKTEKRRAVNLSLKEECQHCSLTHFWTTN